MPPEGYSTVTVSDETFTKLGRLMVREDYDSYAETINAAVDTMLATNPNNLATDELAQMLAARLESGGTS